MNLLCLSVVFGCWLIGLAIVIGFCYLARHLEDEHKRHADALWAIHSLWQQRDHDERIRR